MKIGITSNNFIDLPMGKRFEMFLNAGFNSVMIWIGADAIDTPYERAKLAQNMGLYVENFHASVDNLNDIWVDGNEGDKTIKTFLNEIDDAGNLGVKTIVMHLTHGPTPPEVSAIGLRRMEKVIRHAENCGVKLGFENVITRDHVKYMLDNFKCDTVGLTYDIGHDNIWRVNNWLKDYNDRVYAIHLHDNFGAKDVHLIPYDGNIDIDAKLDILSKSSYKGAVTLETKDIAEKYKDISREEYLKRAYEAGVKIWNKIYKDA